MSEMITYFLSKTKLDFLLGVLRNYVLQLPFKDSVDFSRCFLFSSKICEKSRYYHSLWKSSKMTHFTYIWILAPKRIQLLRSQSCKIRHFFVQIGIVHFFKSFEVIFFLKWVGHFEDLSGWCAFFAYPQKIPWCLRGHKKELVSKHLHPQNPRVKEIEIRATTLDFQKLLLSLSQVAI